MFDCLLQFAFGKCSNNFFAIRIINDLCSLYRVISLFDCKKFFRLIWSATVCKIFFVFLCSHTTTNFKFRTFVIISNIKVNKRTWLSIGRFHFDFSMILLLFWLFYIVCYCIFQLLIQFTNVQALWYYSHMLANFNKIC